MRRALSVGLLSLALTGCSQAPAGRTILLISLDSVRADTLDFGDAAAFPHLAELATKGTVFDQAISSSSWTLPAHATMFTGEPAPLHGVEFDDIAIAPGTTTIPELLHDAGWTTAGWWTGWYTAGEFGFERGFDTYTNGMTGGREIERRYRDALARGDMDMAKRVLATFDIGGHRDITSPNVLAGLEATVETVDGDKDLFLFAHLFDPHYDYIPPAPFDTKFDPDYKGSLDGHDFFENRAIFDSTQSPARRIGDRDLQHIEALYKGEIAFTEDYVGRMLASLEAAGRLESTLVIVTGDHGEEFFEHGNRGHRTGLYDEVLRVPLMIRDPRSLEARHVAEQVGLVDILPTIAGFAGLEAPATSTGVDLSAAVAGQPLATRPMISSLMQHHNELGYFFVESYRTEAAKVIRSMTLNEAGELELVRGEIFDLKLDPGETRSLVTKSTIMDTPRWAEMEAAFDKLRTKFHTLSPVSRLDRSTTIREVFASDLGGLGYAGEAGEEPELVSPGLSLPWPPGPRPALEK